MIPRDAWHFLLNSRLLSIFSLRCNNLNEDPVFGGAPSPDSTSVIEIQCSKSATCSLQKVASNVVGRGVDVAPTLPTKHSNGANSRSAIDNGNVFIGNDTISPSNKENDVSLSPQKCQDSHSHVNNDGVKADKDEDEMTLPGTFESTSASAINVDEESNDARVVDWGNVNVTVADGATVTADEMEETQAILTQVVSNLLIHLNSFPLNFC